MDKEASSSGCGLPTILTVIFVIAKLIGLVEWSWWIVFLPTIIPLILWLIVIIIAVMITIFT